MRSNCWRAQSGLSRRACILKLTSDQVCCNSARSALYRIEQLCQEAVVRAPRRLIAEAIDIVVFIAGRGSSRRIETIAEVTGLDANGDYAVASLTPARLQTL